MPEPVLRALSLTCLWNIQDHNICCLQLCQVPASVSLPVKGGMVRTSGFIAVLLERKEVEKETFGW